MKPKEIDLGFDFDETLLYDLNLPVEEIPISNLLSNADILYLEKENTDDWNLSPAELIKNFNKENSHSKRVLKADANYPVCIYNFKNQWIILDGVHRFTKALMNHDKTIKVKKIDDEILEKIKKE
jgi:hypothetical protein